MMQFEVVVQMKKEVLNPEERAIESTLRRLGLKDLERVKVSKRYVLDISGTMDEATATVKKIAEEYLANSVSETYEVRVL